MKQAALPGQLPVNRPLYPAAHQQCHFGHLDAVGNDIGRAAVKVVSLAVGRIASGGDGRTKGPRRPFGLQVADVGDEHPAIRQVLDEALQVNFSKNLSEIEADWQAALRAQPITPVQVDDLRLSLDLYDTLRRYQRGAWGELPALLWNGAWRPGQSNPSGPVYNPGDASSHPGATATAPAISVTQTCPTTLAVQGGVLTYSGVVHNAGNITLTNVVVMNLKKFQELKPEHQKVLYEALNEATLWERKLNRQFDVEALQKMKTAGVQIEENPDREAFKKIVADATAEEYVKKFGSDVLDKIKNMR